MGGGPGGYVAAIRAAQLGAKVTLIENQHLGGTCLNIGCIPAKCLLHSAELIEQIRTQGEQIGVRAVGLTIDFPQIIAHKNDISRQLTTGVASLLRANRVESIRGEAAFTVPRMLEVTGEDGTKRQMTSDAIILATGSINAQPPIPGMKVTPIASIPLRRWLSKSCQSRWS